MQKETFPAGAWIIIPAYNESSVLGNVLAGVSFAFPRVVVIDDGSTDSTADVASQYPVHLIRHPINLGQGAALQTGFQFVLEKKADVAVTFDADGQMAPDDISTLLNTWEKHKYDVVLGTRFAKESVTNVSFFRRGMLKLATVITRIVTGLDITDVHNGLRAFSAKALQKIEIRNNRMAHASEILSIIKSEGLTYKEIPVTIQYSEYSLKKGQSLSQALNILWDLFFGH
jgi:polyprenyl-phospho-N-acetylgalactosaminyl synthase